MTYDEYVMEVLNWEEYRKLHPVCDNCLNYYEDEGMPCCKYWDNVCENYEEEKCNMWR